MSDVTFRRLSPFGRGAVVVAEIRGRGATALLRKIFRARGATYDSTALSARHGYFCDASGETIDDGMLIPVVGQDPPTYLLTLHGNPLLLDRLLEV
ncbi:MAG: hypothetical protein V3T77_06540, partial [Planctomycetota bacterium]